MRKSGLRPYKILGPVDRRRLQKSVKSKIHDARFWRRRNRAAPRSGSNFGSTSIAYNHAEFSADARSSSSSARSRSPSARRNAAMWIAARSCASGRIAAPGRLVHFEVNVARARKLYPTDETPAARYDGRDYR